MLGNCAKMVIWKDNQNSLYSNFYLFKQSQKCNKDCCFEYISKQQQAESQTLLKQCFKKGRNFDMMSFRKIQKRQFLNTFCKNIGRFNKVFDPFFYR